MLFRSPIGTGSGRLDKMNTLADILPGPENRVVGRHKRMLLVPPPLLYVRKKPGMLAFPSQRVNTLVPRTILGADPTPRPP